MKPIDNLVKTMKPFRQIFLMITMAIASSVFAQMSDVESIPDNVVIEGTTNIIPDGKVITLYHLEGNVGKSIASDTIRYGKFLLSTTIDEPIKASVICFEPNLYGASRDLRLSPGTKVLLRADSHAMRDWEVVSDSPEQKEQDAYYNNAKSLWKAYNSFDSIQSEIDKILNDPNSSDSERQKASTCRQHIVQRQDSIENLISMKDIEYMSGIPHSPIWLERFAKLCQRHDQSSEFTFLPNLKSLYETLNEDELATAYGRQAAAYLFPPKVIEIGDMAPYDDIYDLQGNVHHLSEFRGKWVLLEIWSVGCGACHYAFPEIKKFVENHSGQVEMVSLSCDNEKMWNFSTNLFDISWNNWNDLQEYIGLYQKFGIDGFPSFIAIDPDGIVRNKSFGYSNGALDKMIQQ